MIGLISVVPEAYYDCFVLLHILRQRRQDSRRCQFDISSSKFTSVRSVTAITVDALLVQEHAIF